MDAAAPTRPGRDPRWWRDAVVYQVYVRSFADADGDGTGDLAGVRQRLPYLAELGVDAVWFNPWYPSPMADSGYDVADYRAIDPRFGTLAEAEAFIAEAAALGIRTVIDLVPNHISAEHPWFRDALAAAPGSGERAHFWFAPGRGHHGEEPPTDVTSIFGGPAWTRTKDADGAPGEWYLHLFTPEQPDLNWNHPEVRAEHEDVLRFWFDRGVAGIRIDSAALLVKDDRLLDADDTAPPEERYTDQDGVHDVYRSWRAVADAYDPPRALIGELWLPDAERFGNYLRGDELHTAFNFDFLGCAWDHDALTRSIDTTLHMHRDVDAPATWVLANHDVTRTVTRYGRADTTFAFETRRDGVPTDLGLGRRRARAAALLTLALPGSVYLYQGEELGLPEVDVPPARREDPMFFRSGGTNPGRDGCRTPLPWSETTPPYGFSPRPVRTWLDQPRDWAELTVAAQAKDPTSMLSLYRTAIALRREHLHGPFAWRSAPSQVLAFDRGDRLSCHVNLGPSAVPLPADQSVLLASAELDGGLLPPDTAVWLVRPVTVPHRP